MLYKFIMNRGEEEAIHPYNLEQAMRRFQRDYIRNIIEVANWDMPVAAKMLGIGLDELKQKMNFYGAFEDARNRSGDFKHL